MPYRHAGEIGDVWKCLPVCEALCVERPRRHFETNAASADDALPGDAPAPMVGEAQA